MGREVAKMLSERGANLILVARNKEKLAEALDYARSHARHPSTQRFHFISADVTTEAENDRLLAEATAWNNGEVPEIVWTNAGQSTPGLWLDTPMGVMRQQMDLNYWSHAYLAHKTLKAWLYPETPYEPRERNGKPELPRHFIMTSSAIAFLNLAGYNPYGPAKTALKGLADGLRNEVLLYNGARRSAKKTAQAPAPFDVKIQLVFPGNMTTPGHEIEDKTKHPVTFILEESDPVQTDVEAATASIKGLENGNYMTATNWLCGLMRISSLGGAPRDSYLRDTFGQWLTSIVWLFVGPDLDGKVWGWGKKEGMPEMKTQEKLV